MILRMQILAVALTTAALVAPVASMPARTDATPQKPATEQKLPVSLEQALYLIRSTLLTLNDADRTGNYTVFRELAAPDFQATNSPADLRAI